MEVVKIIIIIFYAVFLLSYLLRLKSQNALHMNIEPLSHQPLFKAVLIIPFVSFITFGLISWLGHTVQLDSDGLNNFLSISKLPLALLSLSAPFAVLVNNIHRTIQMKAQIQEAQKKNTSDMFYSHQKYITELLANTNCTPFKYKIKNNDENSEEFIAKIDRPIKLYKKIFTKSNSSNNSFEIDFAFKYYTKKLPTKLIHNLKILKQNSNDSTMTLSERAKHLWELIDVADSLYRYYEIQSFFRNSHQKLETDDFTLQILHKDEPELLCLIIDYWDILSYVTDIIGLKHNPRELFNVLNVNKDFLDDIFLHADFVEVKYNSDEEGYKLTSL